MILKKHLSECKTFYTWLPKTNRWYNDDSKTNINIHKNLICRSSVVSKIL